MSQTLGWCIGVRLLERASFVAAAVIHRNTHCRVVLDRAGLAKSGAMCETKKWDSISLQK